MIYMCFHASAWYNTNERCSRDLKAGVNVDPAPPQGCWIRWMTTEMMNDPLLFPCATKTLNVLFPITRLRGAFVYLLACSVVDYIAQNCEVMWRWKIVKSYPSEGVSDVFCTRWTRGQRWWIWPQLIPREELIFSLWNKPGKARQLCAAWGIRRRRKTEKWKLY